MGSNLRQNFRFHPALMSKLYTFAAAVILVSTPSFAGVDEITNAVRTTRDITLDDAVQTAVRQNPDIQRARQEIKRTRGVVIEVRAQALPRIGVTSTYNQQDRRLLEDSGGAGATNTTTTADSQALASSLSGLTTSGTSSGLTADQLSSLEQLSGAQNNSSASRIVAQDKSWNITIEGRQLIYSGGQVAAAMRIAKLTQDSSFYSLRDTVDRVIAVVRQQFYEVLLDRALITVQEESVRLLESQLADQQNRFQAGTVPRFNVLQAEVALANARPNLIRVRSNYNLAELNLAKTLGIDYETAPIGVPPINPVGNLATSEQPLPLAAALELARERRPFLKVQRQQILIEVQQIKVALAGYQPQLEANGGYTFRNSHLSNNLDDTVNGWFFGFTGTWDIFDGFATYGRTKQAKARLEQARITYGDSVRQVEYEVQQALDNIRVAVQTIASQAKAVQEAEEAVRLASERLAAGAGTQLDVLNAQVALTQARSTALQARYDYNAAIAEFDRATARDTQYEDTFDDPLTRKKMNAPLAQPTPPRQTVLRAERVK
jgi:outer membrane protein TolC